MAPPAEITIPTTSLSKTDDGSKPYTLYNITLRLPLHTCWRPPPAPLPAKSWFKSTISSPQLTEDRRRGLETYMRGIAESPDRRWRDTPAWRTFLNLPGNSNSAGNSAASVRAGGGFGIPNRDAARNAGAQDPGTWLDLHKDMKAELQEARRCLARRDNATDNGTALEAGAAAKRSLVKAAGYLTSLGDGLRGIAENKRLGEGEIRRRKDLLAAARVDREDLDKLISSITPAMRTGGHGSSSGMPSASDKVALLGGGGRPRASGRVLGVPLPETDRTRELDNKGVLQLQKEMMQEQEQDVESLTKLVQRQREIAETINGELSLQNEMLGAVDDNASRLDKKTNIAKKRVKNLR
ncbi:vacuolar morphogenesis 7 like [Apiospora phragmitis]|uniref:Vacuolar morphogenesis 7 like n=1 Tax=Apiospora phragmitis TaxID=2905665 RepID=A0ABR1VXS7_9PEZI